MSIKEASLSRGNCGSSTIRIAPGATGMREIPDLEHRHGYHETVKTNAARLLDSMGITYELREYEVDPDDLRAESVARKIGMPPEQVYKTLVARGDQTGVCLAVVPGSTELDLKKIASLTGNRRVDTVPLKEVQPLTGYIRGGVTALGCRKKYPVVADETITLWDRISVSAGLRGSQIILAPGDYIAAVEAMLGDITKSR